MRKIYHNKPFKPRYMVPLAQKLRKNMTPHECLLWPHIRERQILGFKFRRQAPYGRFILDFYCSEKKLAIELDGFHHNYQKEKDKARDEFLLACGVRTLRLTNKELKKDVNSALDRIKSALLHQ